MKETINCLKATELYSERRDRTLSTTESEMLAQHIEECELCQHASQQLDQVFQQLQQLLGQSAEAR